MASNFLERSVASLRLAGDRALFSETVARVPDRCREPTRASSSWPCSPSSSPRCSSRDLRVLAALFAAAMTLAMVAGRPALGFLLRALLAATAITGMAVLPALVLTPGDAMASLPFGLFITRQGVLSAAFLLARVETATTLSLLLVLTTRWADLLRALRMIGTPVVLIAIIGMTHRYIFVLLEIAGQLFDGRRSRRVGTLPPDAERRLAGATAGALLTRTLRLTEDVYLAMQSRGFRGEVHVLREPRMRPVDWLMMAGFILAAAASAMMGR